MIAFWLVPVERQKEFFASAIRALAARFDAPVFEPHVTLHGGAMEEERAVELLERIAASTAPLQLQMGEIAFSEKYTKTLFVQLRATAGADALSAAFAQAAGSKSGYHFDPHLSLLYHEMPMREKEALAREIEIPFQDVSCDALKAVSIPAEISAREDVQAWRPLAERRLER